MRRPTGLLGVRRRLVPGLALLLVVVLLGLAPVALAQQPPGGSAAASPPPPGAEASPPDLAPPARDAAPPAGAAGPSSPEPAASGTPDPAPVATSAPTASNGGAMAFFLVVVLGLFGYHLFTSFNLNARIDRLEELLRRGRGAPERDALVPFSWDTVLRSLESGFPFLPGTSLPRPGLVLLGVDSPELGRAILARVAWTVLQDPELAVVAVARGLGPDELGRRLLSLEAGRDWAGLGPDERQALLGRSARTLERYERSLFSLSALSLEPRQLFEACQEILGEAELGAVLVEGLEVLAPPDGQAFDPVEHLRLLAARCHVPVFLAVPRDSQVWTERSGSARFLAVAEVAEQAGEGARMAFERFPGTLPAEPLLLDRPPAEVGG